MQKRCQTEHERLVQLFQKEGGGTNEAQIGDLPQGSSQPVHPNSTRAPIELQLVAAPPQSQTEMWGQAASQAIDESIQQIKTPSIERILGLDNPKMLDVI